jgi:hypothetical protein
VSSLLSLASPHVILVEYGALTLALYTINKNPGWVPDGGSSDEFTQGVPRVLDECSPSQLSLWSMETQREDVE